MEDARLDRAIAAIDAVNAQDPNLLDLDGAARPKEIVHAEMMTSWVRRLDPAASEAQLIAARAHHLRRWSVPRSSQPDGRAGYLRWRTALRKQHAAEVAAILTDVGYDEATIQRVRAIVNKEALATDPDVQTHEDALCLVFLEMQLAEIADRLGDDKTVEVVRKTAAKMSPAALALAVELPLRDQDRRLVERALEG